MATTTWNGITVPAGTDLYNLAPDLKTLAESATVIVPAASEVARNAIAAATTPSATNPVVVYRTDTSVFEVSENGTTWTSYVGQEDVTSQLTLASGTLISAGGWTAIRTGRTVTLTAQVAGGWAGGSAWTTQALLNIPVGLRPNRSAWTAFPYHGAIGIGATTAGLFSITTSTGTGTSAGTYDVTISWTLA